MHLKKSTKAESGTYGELVHDLEVV